MVTVIWYVNCSQRHIWEALSGYCNRDWNDLCDKLHHKYVSPSTEAKFTKQRLVEFATKYALKHMDNKANVINYQHKFNTLSKTILNSGRITKGEYNTIFWQGFHSDDQRILCECLIAKQPD